MTSEKEIKTPTIRDFRPFLPSGEKGYEESKNFYQDIGFTILWTSSEVTEFDTGFGNRFLLSSNKNEKLGENLMIQIWVESADEWYKFLKSKRLDEKYVGTKIAEPSVAPWGWKITYVWDPAGVLLHFAEPHSEENKLFFGQATWL